MIFIWVSTHRWAASVIQDGTNGSGIKKKKKKKLAIPLPDHREGELAGSLIKTKSKMRVQWLT